jgi:hypothetical protein
MSRPIGATEKVLTIAQLKEALKPKYYADIRYKSVEGAPPAGSAPSPPEGATSLLEKIEEGATGAMAVFRPAAPPSSQKTP